MFLVGVLLALGVQVHMLEILEGKMIVWWKNWSLTLLVGELVGLGVALLEGDMLKLKLGLGLGLGYRLMLLVGVLLALGYGQHLIWDYSAYPIFQTIN